jgi:four helix bundle protein
MTTVGKGYRDLEVWQRSMKLAKNIYESTARFPGEEKFGLVQQMRRAAVSIPSKLAEGHARLSVAEFQHFVSIAMGSAAELETQVLLSIDLSYLRAEEKNHLLKELEEIRKMLRGLYKYLTSCKRGTRI